MTSTSCELSSRKPMQKIPDQGTELHQDAAGTNDNAGQQRPADGSSPQHQTPMTWRERIRLRGTSTTRPLRLAVRGSSANWSPNAEPGRNDRRHSGCERPRELVQVYVHAWDSAGSQPAAQPGQMASGRLIAWSSPAQSCLRAASGWRNPSPFSFMDALRTVAWPSLENLMRQSTPWARPDRHQVPANVHCQRARRLLHQEAPDSWIAPPEKSWLPPMLSKSSGDLCCSWPLLVMSGGW